MGIQLECQYEEDLTKQPEARVRWYEAAGGTTLWEMTTDPVRARRVFEVWRCLPFVAGGGLFVDFGSLEGVGAVAAGRRDRVAATPSTRPHESLRAL